jgi:glycosyltransferase involved in cell wall biosynthesis
MKYKEGVSLIICTYNGAKLLRDTIGFVNMQKVHADVPWEFIVIDNASDDDSAEVALNSLKPGIPIRVITEPEKGLIHARNRGIKEAVYEYISFIDDDNWIDPGWIQQIYDIFRAHPEVGMCGGKSSGVFEVDPPSWFKAIEGSYAIGSQGIETGDTTNTWGHLWGAGLSFRKSVFEGLIGSGFKSVLTGRKGKNLSAGEDTELVYAFRMAGWHLWYSEKLTLQHYIPSQRFKWEYVVRMYNGFGKSHAVFDIYLLVLNQMPYHSCIYYKSIVGGFLPYLKMKLTGRFRYTEGSVDYLNYTLHKAKLCQAIGNFFKNKNLYCQIRDFRQKSTSGT